MATETVNENKLFSIDYMKEMERWNNVFKLFNEPEPSTWHTPRQSVWKKNKATLWHYAAVEKKYDIPVVFIYSLINQPYILDYTTETSVINLLNNSGYDVYLLDWGIAGGEDKDITIEDYVYDYIRKGVQRALRHSGAEAISLVGYCLGGTLAAMYASIADEPIKNLVVAAIPIDFDVAIMPEKWVDGIKEGILDVDRVANVFGLIQPKTVEMMFRSVTSPVYFTPYAKLLTRAYDQRFVEKWRRMNNWTKGHVPLTGGALRQLYNDLFKENKLVKGSFTIRGMKADLGNIEANLLVVSPISDQLVPQEQSRPLMELVSSKDKTFQVEKAGHVTLALTGKFAGVLDEWLRTRS